MKAVCAVSRALLDAYGSRLQPPFRYPPPEHAGLDPECVCGGFCVQPLAIDQDRSHPYPPRQRGDALLERYRFAD